MAIESLRDLNENTIFPGHVGMGTVTFIDLVPNANWAHPCRYVFDGDDGTHLECDSKLPPEESDEWVKA
jgi:hypothetical protein